MLQRIQTLYLVGIIICSVLLNFTVLASVTTLEHRYDFSIKGVFNVTDNTPQSVSSSVFILLTNLIISLTACVLIFLFKNRKKQLILARINLLLLVGLVAGLFYYFESALSYVTELDKLNSANSASINYNLYALLPLIAIVFNLLAIRAIAKDEELVRSADRIR